MKRAVFLETKLHSNRIFSWKPSLTLTGYVGLAFKYRQKITNNMSDTSTKLKISCQYLSMNKI